MMQNNKKIVCIFISIFIFFNFTSFAFAEQKVICIDAGHQSKGNYQKEPIGPGAKTTKAKVASGTKGVSTKKPEYVLTLEISMLLKKKLEEAGYKVIMVREKHDVNISNKERADIANDANVDLFLRIHADGSENQKASGISVLYPSSKNQYVSYLHKDSKRMAELLIAEMIKSTGAVNRGAVTRDDMSGINWAKVPVCIIETGFMTNPSEDVRLSTEEYQEKLASGMVSAVNSYFGLKNNSTTIVKKKSLATHISFRN